MTLDVSVWMNHSVYQIKYNIVKIMETHLHQQYTN